MMHISQRNAAYLRVPCRDALKTYPAGFVMMEVVIALALIALLLFSLLRYETVLYQASEAALFNTVAQQQLLNLSERLRIASYVDPVWHAENSAWLPSGMGFYQVKNNHTCALTLQWKFQKKHFKSMDVYCHHV